MSIGKFIEEATLSGLIPTINGLITKQLSPTREVFTAGPTFIGSVAGTVLTITSVTSGILVVGQVIYGAGVTTGTTISSLGSGSGGTGTYNISVSQTISSISMAAASATQFAPGFSTSITLAGTYGVVNNIEVFMDSSYQGAGALSSLVGNLLTFTSVVPIGVVNVFVNGGLAQTVGVPPASSVGVGQLATDTLGYFAKVGDLALGTAASTIGYTQTGANVIPTNVASVLGETRSVFRYLTTSQIADTQSGTPVLDLAIPLQAAFNGGANYMPAGTYLSGPISMPSGINLTGAGIDQTILIRKGNAASQFIMLLGKFTISGITFNGQNANTYSLLYSGNYNNTNSKITNCKFINPSTGNFALYLNWTGAAIMTNVEISNCIFDSCLYGGSGIFTTVKGHRNIRIFGNTYTNCGSSICAMHAPNWSYFFDVDVSYNKIINCSSTGTYGPIPMEIWGVYNYTCIGNIIDSGTRGLDGGGQKINSVISNNVISNNTLGLDGGAAINMVISNNTFINNGGAIGFINYVQGTNNYQENIKIIGNNIVGGGTSFVTGTAAIKASPGQYKNFTIENNTIVDSIFLSNVIYLPISKSEPVVTFTDTGGTGGSAYVTLNVVSVDVLYGGYGYSNSPTLVTETIDGSGSGATFTATVVNGQITTVAVGSVGTLYAQPPNILVTDTTGVGAILRVVMGIESIVILSGGSGYVSPTIGVSDFTGTGFTGAVQTSSGIITGATITTPGAYYGLASIVSVTNNNIVQTSQYSPQSMIVITGGKSVQICDNNIFQSMYLDNSGSATIGTTLGYAIIKTDTTITNGRNSPNYEISRNRIRCLNTYASGVNTYYAIGASAPIATYSGHVIRDNIIEGNFRGSAVIRDATSSYDLIVANNNTINTVLTGTYSGRVAGYSQTILTASGTASPLVGTWRKGDILKNSSPVVGSPKGWVCTVAGTPGTWVSEGNL